MAQINLGGSVGTTGNVGILGNASVVFATDADHALLPAEYSNNFLECTSGVSLTATRNLVAPLVQGQCFIVQNKTTGGQAIQVIGSSGTGVLVPNGATVSVVCDGTNYVPVAVASVTGSAPVTSTGGTTPAIGLQAGATVNVSVANAAALTAYGGTVALLAGALALVQSRQTLWAYQPGDASAADGWHIAAAGGGNWVYVAAADGATQAQTPAWFVSSAGSDDNAGTSSGAPLATKAEIMRRWGAWNPTINGIAVTINYLTPDTTSVDPGLLRPTPVNGARITHTSPLPIASFTGTLNVVTAKVNNSAPGNALASTFTVSSGAVVANMLLVNTTRGNSRAFAQRNLGGGNWQITQPCVAYAGSGFALPTEVNTWAGGDSITGYVLNPVNLADISQEVGGNEITGLTVVWQLSVKDFSGSGLDTLNVAALCLLAECVVSRGISGRGSSLEITLANSVALAPLSGAVIFVLAGAVLGQGFYNGTLLGLGTDVIVNLGTQVLPCPYNANGPSAVCVDSNFVVVGAQISAWTGSFYGAGTLNFQNSFLYSGAPAATFLCAISLNGLATGYSLATAAGVTTVHGGIALSGTTLAAAAGAAGFGGTAFGGGATITNGTQP